MFFLFFSIACTVLQPKFLVSLSIEVAQKVMELLYLFYVMELLYLFYAFRMLSPILIIC